MFTWFGSHGSSLVPNTLGIDYSIYENLKFIPLSMFLLLYHFHNINDKQYGMYASCRVRVVFAFNNIIWNHKCVTPAIRYWIYCSRAALSFLLFVFFLIIYYSTHIRSEQVHKFINWKATIQLVTIGYGSTHQLKPNTYI